MGQSIAEIIATSQSNPGVFNKNTPQPNAVPRANDSGKLPASWIAGMTTSTSGGGIALNLPLDLAVGASTAAAGNAVGNGGALPAGTATIYPTTGADDTKGVVIDTTDAVTGRVLFIGNGVSNKILKVYGPSGAVINGAAADAAYSSASGKGVLIVCLSGSGNTWLAIG